MFQARFAETGRIGPYCFVCFAAQDGVVNPSRRCVLLASCLAAQPRCLLAAGEPAGPVEVDIADLAPEQLRLAQWNGKPIWILRRSPDMLSQLESPQLLSRLADPASALGLDSAVPKYARNSLRSIKRDVFVGIAICPHAGCVPVPRLKAGPRPEDPENWPGGFACQCHFATFDLAGRVFKDKPTRENIEVPRHMFLTDTRVVIGKDEDGEA